MPGVGGAAQGPAPLDRGKSRRHAAIRSAARRRNITRVWMVLRRARPPRIEAHHEGMLRSGVPHGGVISPRCGWCCAGPGPLGERQMTTESSRATEKEGGGRSESRHSALFKTSTQPQEVALNFTGLMFAGAANEKEIREAKQCQTQPQHAPQKSSRKELPKMVNHVSFWNERGSQNRPRRPLGARVRARSTSRRPRSLLRAAWGRPKNARKQFLPPPSK